MSKLYFRVSEPCSHAGKQAACNRTWVTVESGTAQTGHQQPHVQDTIETITCMRGQIHYNQQPGHQPVWMGARNPRWQDASAKHMLGGVVQSPAVAGVPSHCQGVHADHRGSARMSGLPLTRGCIKTSLSPFICTMMPSSKKVEKSRHTDLQRSCSKAPVPTCHLPCVWSPPAFTGSPEL